MNSVYVHIPFCLSKCRYCGFNSVPATETVEIEGYCRALEREIRSAKYELRNLTTLYFGGGTPTILEPKRISDIMSVLRRKTAFGQEAEVTIEANPETVDLVKLRALRDTGFNRLSLGVQSFNDECLEFLGRVHDGKRARQAFEQARQAGFENVGIDLIYGIPGQGLDRWKDELRMAVALGPEHISAYSLAYEPGTEFTAWRDSGRIAPCQDDLEAEMFLAAIDVLGQAGYQHYEVSNFAKPDLRSRHNMNYWLCGDYLGFGAGAHSHLAGRRWANMKSPEDYALNVEKGGSTVDFEEELSKEQRIFEAIFLGLRMVEGIGLEEFTAKWGKSPLDFRPETWKNLIAGGMAIMAGPDLRLTTKGLLIADVLLSEFAP